MSSRRYLNAKIWIILNLRLRAFKKLSNEEFLQNSSRLTVWFVWLLWRLRLWPPGRSWPGIRPRLLHDDAGTDKDFSSHLKGVTMEGWREFLNEFKTKSPESCGLPAWKLQRVFQASIKTDLREKACSSLPKLTTVEWHNKLVRNYCDKIYE